EAIQLVQSGSYTKFPGTIEAHLNTAAKGLRGLVSLPFAAGKKLTILAFGPSNGSGLKDTEGVILGDDETIKDIEAGKINFDVLVTTAEWMPKLARVAKILGPRGLMPNPKSGTITENLGKTVEELQAGKTEYKTESSSPVIHLSVGKTTQPKEEIVANIKALYNTIGKSRIKKLTLSPTMGPGVKVDLGTI
ncbi:MAG: 50S ribosomal protein L1, partial [Candidatus Daviesbacteria bacterium]